MHCNRGPNINNKHLKQATHAGNAMTVQAADATSGIA